jgi:hypothetical protein
MKIEQKELHKLLDTQASFISRQINDGKLVTTEFNGETIIDFNSKVNRKWLKDYEIRTGKTLNVAVIPEKKPKRQHKAQQENTDINKDSTTTSTLEDIKIQKGKCEIEKIKISTKKEILQVEKISGSLIPTDECIHVMSYVVNSIISDISSHTSNQIDIIVKELGGDEEDNIRMKKRADDAMIGFAGNKIKELVDMIGDIVSNYEETRGRGERK